MTGHLTESAARSPERRRRVERMFIRFCLAGACVAIAALVTLLTAVLVLGLEHVDLSFLTGRPSRFPEEAGFYPALIGSIWILAVCAATGVPLGVGAAIFLEEFRPRRPIERRAHKIVETNIRNLAGVPSIVYGLVALTVFVRAFGLFGAPTTFEPFDRLELSDGSTVFGRIVDTRDEVYRLEADGVGGIDLERSTMPGLADPPGSDQVLHIGGLVEFNEDFQVVFETEAAGTIVIDAWQFEDPPNDGEPFPARAFDGTLTLLGAGERVVESPTQGRVVVPNLLVDDPVEDIDTIPVRTHTFRLADGTTVRGAIESMEDGLVAVTTRSSGEAVTFRAADVRRHTYSSRLSIGDEDRFYHVRLPFEQSVLSGGLVLMLVVLPIIIIASQEALRAVPGSLREGAFALGATRWQMVRTTTLPAAIPGILTGVILALSRAIGEAAPILVVGGSVFITHTPDSLMSGFAAMPLQIYHWTGVPNEDFRHVAASGIIVLLIVLLSFNALAIFIRRRMSRPLQ